jgi:hypothetical protein
MPLIPPPTAVPVLGCQYSAPNGNAPVGHFAIMPSAAQFGAVDYGDGAGTVPTHLSFLFICSAQQGATLNSALLTLTNGPLPGTSAAGLASVESVDNAVAPINAPDAMARVLDANQVAFTAQAGAGAVTTINLTAGLQALFTRQAWAPWNLFQLHLRCSNGQPGFCNPGLVPTLAIVASTADPTLSFCQQMVAKLEAALLQNPTAQSINIDGVTTTYVDIEARLKYFYRQMALEQGTRRTFMSVDLGGFSG